MQISVNLAKSTQASGFLRLFLKHSYTAQCTVNACTALCKTLLNTTQSTPRDTLFRDNLFKKTCLRLRNENEAMVLRDISPLIVPPAEILHAFGDEQLEHLTGHVNQK
jgi:hypothetical protein